MHLVDLDPQWILRGDRRVGVRFVCPVDDGDGPHTEGHQVCVLFANPPDGGAAHPDDTSVPGNNGGERWTLSGSSFADMSLSPSVDCTRGSGCTKPNHTLCSHAHCWHGRVSAGLVA